MNEPVITSFYLMAGIYAYAAFNHFSVGLHRPYNLPHLLFAGMCLLLVPFTLLHIQVMQSTNVPDFTHAIKWNLAVILPCFLLFPWFIAFHTGIRPRLLLEGFTGLVAILFIANLTQPYSLQYDHLAGLRTLHLPWGEDISRGDGEHGYWAYVTIAVVMMVFAYALYALYSTYRLSRRTLDLLMLLAVGLFLISTVEGILVRLSVLNYFENGPFGFMVMVFVMSAVLTHETQQQLRSSERRYRTLYEHSPISIHEIDLQGRFISMNQSGLSMFGQENEGKICGVPFMSAVGEDDSDRINMVFQDALKGTECHFEFATAGIKPLRFKSCFIPICDSKGQVLKIMGLAEDITEKKRAEEDILEQREFFRLIAEHSGDFIAVLDLEGRRLYNSPSYNKLFKNAEFLKDTDSFAEIHPDDYGPVKQAFNETVRSGRGIETEFRFVLPDGSIHHMESIGGLIRDSNGNPLRVVVVSRDITERKKADENLRIYASVFNNCQESIVITNVDHTILDVNPAFTHITGYTREEVVGKSPVMLNSGRQNMTFYSAMWQSIEQKKTWRGEIWNKRKNGEDYPELLSVVAISDITGKVQRHVALSLDISQIKEHEAELSRIAHYDVLTGMPNRVLLADRMRQAIAQATREKSMLSVCYLDLDGFKPVNDALGHESGDEVLIEIAKRIGKIIRGGDTVARLGGDEFVLLLQGFEMGEECVATLQRLLATIAQPIHVKNTLLTLSASIGVSIFPLDDENPDILLRHADQAMYVAKQSGKNRFHIYDPTLDLRARSHHEFVKSIRQGIELGQFELHYQPKVCLSTKKLVGAEALIRWRHPERGLLSPAEFLRFIENTDLDIEVGDWVISTALAQINRWRIDGQDIQVSINISAYHLESPNFAEKLQKHLGRYPNIPHGRLQIEILETAALNDIIIVRDVLGACREFGVTFALDDFGTGYSSLSYLSGLPVDVLKIDQSFIRDMLEDKGDMAIVHGIIALARAFDRQIVAEGIETEEHYQVLLEMGCEVGQGFGIARPMPANELVKWSADSQFQNQTRLL